MYWSAATRGQLALAEADFWSCLHRLANAVHEAHVAVGGGFTEVQAAATLEKAAAAALATPGRALCAPVFEALAESYRGLVLRGLMNRGVAPDAARALLATAETAHREADPDPADPNNGLEAGSWLEQLGACKNGSLLPKRLRDGDAVPEWVESCRESEREIDVAAGAARPCRLAPMLMDSENEHANSFGNFGLVMDECAGKTEVLDKTVSLVCCLLNADAMFSVSAKRTTVVPLSGGSQAIRRLPPFL